MDPVSNPGGTYSPPARRNGYCRSIFVNSYQMNGGMTESAPNGEYDKISLTDKIFSILEMVVY